MIIQFAQSILQYIVYIWSGHEVTSILLPGFAINYQMVTTQSQFRDLTDIYLQPYTQPQPPRQTHSQTHMHTDAQAVSMASLLHKQ